jgi:putative Mg2+ transporter-C (MgtC) family protein
MVGRGTGPRSHWRHLGFGGLPSTRRGAKSFSVMDILDIALRLGAATLIGVVLGLNRDLHGKSTGVRTPRRPVSRLGLGSSVYPCGNRRRRQPRDSRDRDWRWFSGCRRDCPKREGHHVQGLTTAAVVWVTASMGAACAVARWQIVVIGVVFVFVILVFSGPFEKAIDRRWPRRPMEVADRPPDTTRGN